MDVFDRNRAKSRSAIARSSIFSAPGAAKKSTAFTSVGVSKVSKRANAAAAAGAFAGIFSGGGGVGGAAAAAARREGAKASSADGRAKRLAARRSESSKGGGAETTCAAVGLSYHIFSSLSGGARRDARSRLRHLRQRLRPARLRAFPHDHVPHHPGDALVHDQVRDAVRPRHLPPQLGPVRGDDGPVVVA
eukprot:31182-Pelagococcus_subviridis.AAC.11